MLINLDTLKTILNGIFIKINTIKSELDGMFIKINTIESEVDNSINDSVADWNQNDPDAADYVKNRTHYESETITDIWTDAVFTTGNKLTETEWDGIPLSFYSSKTTLAYSYFNCFDGDKFIITVDGVSYSVVYQRAYDRLGLGSYIDNNLPVMIGHGSMGSMFIMGKEPNKTYTISVKKVVSSVVQLDEKFIPDTIARVEYVQSYVDEAIENLDITSLATEDYVNDAIANLVNSAPDALNTLDELAAALGDDANFATTVTNQIAGKLDASALTGAINDALAQAKASGEFNGVDGKNGKDGTNGVSATHSWNGTTLTVTSASGTSSADLKGDKGDEGDPGAPGYTPVRGTDYWTDADKAEIKAYIDDNMPEGTHSDGSSDSIAQVQTDYEQNDTTAVDYIKNRPFYEETKNVFNQSVTTAPNADFMNMNLYPHNQCIIDTTMIDFDNDTFDNIDIIMDVTMNDTNYSCNLKLVEGMYVIGNIYMYLEAIAASAGITVDYLLSVAPEYGILNVDSGEPFLINFELPSSESSGHTAFLTKEAGTHSFVISQNTIRKINSKFIPKVDGLPSVTTADNDKILMVVDGAWTVASIDNGDEVAY